MRLKSFTFLLLLILITLSGCGRKNQITGKEYVAKEVFVDVLVDIHLINGIVENRKYYQKYNYNDSIDMITPIFEKHYITKEKFDSTMAEYCRYPELLDIVYDEVIMQLNVMLDEVDEQNEVIKEKPLKQFDQPVNKSLKD